MSPALSAPLWPALLSVFIGAGCGACLRFALGQTLNRLLPQLPLGTLAANLIGGYLVGVAIAFFAWRSELSVLWRLALITGFLGGLTTFSTFSAEVVNAASRGEPGWALTTAVAHLAGSLLLTVLGLATVRVFVAS
jgi:fluoride exporter